MKRPGRYFLATGIGADTLTDIIVKATAATGFINSIARTLDGDVSISSVQPRSWAPRTWLKIAHRYTWELDARQSDRIELRLDRRWPTWYRLLVAIMALLVFFFIWYGITSFDRVARSETTNPELSLPWAPLIPPWPALFLLFVLHKSTVDNTVDALLERIRRELRTHGTALDEIGLPIRNRGSLAGIAMLIYVSLLCFMLMPILYVDRRIESLPSSRMSCSG